MNSLSLLSVGLSAKARSVSAEAATLAFPQFTLTDVAKVEEALRAKPVSGVQILLIGDVDQTSFDLAAAAVDSSGLKRWGIVNFGACVSKNSSVTAGPAEEDLRPQWISQIFKMTARAHELERENARLRGDLSTVGRRISHDMRSPLSGIYTSCEAINEILGEHTSDHTELTKAIITSTDDQLHIIERVSFLLKASAEQSASEVVPMAEVVFRALQSTESAMARKGVSVTQPSSWPQVQGNAAWLEVIWLNLLRNALQHSTDGTRIEIGWSADATGQHQFWIENSGQVNPRRVGKLFHPFHLLHQPDAPRGLGLSIVQRLVDLQEGTCGCETSAAGGTRFFFTLPPGKSA